MDSTKYVYSTAQSLWNSATLSAWTPVVSTCRNGALAQLKHIRLGKLAIYERGLQKPSMAFGEEKEGLPLAVLHVHDEKFWLRLALFADMVCLASYKLIIDFSVSNTSTRDLQKVTCSEKYHLPTSLNFSR